MNHHKRKPSQDVPRHSNPPPLIKPVSSSVETKMAQLQLSHILTPQLTTDMNVKTEEEEGMEAAAHHRIVAPPTQASKSPSPKSPPPPPPPPPLPFMSNRVNILNSLDMDAQEAIEHEMDVKSTTSTMYEPHDEDHPPPSISPPHHNVPKAFRPMQPDTQREYFERLWAENFERSKVHQEPQAPGMIEALKYIPVGAFASLLCINGFSNARDTKTNRIYTVYRLEMECHVNDKRWTVYRRYQDFKQLSDALKVRGYQLPVQLPPKTLLRSFGTSFLNRRQAELQKWLQKIMSSSYIAGDVMDSDTMRLFLTAMANQPPRFEESKGANSSAVPRSNSGRLDSCSDSFEGEGGSYSDTNTSTPKNRRGLSEPESEIVSMDHRMTVDDFDLLRVVGKGSFGKVLLVRRKETYELFAMKILNKPTVVKKKQVEHTRTERRVLANVKHPFIVQLHYAFQTPKSLYFLLDYCPGGDMFFHLSRFGCFKESMARFYAAEITLALLHLHDLGVIYRDLKPENIMLDVEGHVKLADFGLAKEGIADEAQGTNTMCGTPEYLPPEILNRTGHGKAVDWWNLGMVLYELLTGRPPWYTTDRVKLFIRLRNCPLEFPENISMEAQSLISGLLNRNPQDRLGSNSSEDLLSHPFFKDIDWTQLYHRAIPPPFQPCQFADPSEATNFESVFTDIPVQSEMDEKGPATYTNTTTTTPSGRGSLLRAMSYTFQGFTYEGQSDHFH